MKIDHIPGCILGVFWTTASWSSTENSIQITNKRKNLLEEVHNFLTDFGYNYTIYKCSEIKRKNTSNKYKYIYYRLKIYNNYIIHLLREEYNWRGRKEYKRFYPNLEDESREQEFIKCYLQEKSCIDNISETRKRVRVFANWNFIDKLNQRINFFLGTNINKPQSHRQSDKMKVIYYQSQKDVREIEKFIR